MQQALQQPRLTIKPLLITLAIFIALTFFIGYQLKTIEPVPADAPDHVFSGERAFNALEKLVKEQLPHPVDSAANRVIEERIVGLLNDMGYQSEIQQAFSCIDNNRGSARCATVRNIIVHIEGSKPGNGILLSAHYDSVGAGPGGSDAGAAIGTLLETARLLMLEGQPINSIVLLFNEGEEPGLLGARAFMDHPLAKDLKLALNVEARGSGGKSVLFETGENSGWLIKHYAATSPAPFSSSLFYEVYNYLPNSTDMTVYKDHGLQGLNFAHAERLAHYHTPMDNLANLDRGSLQHHGDNVWGVLKQIKDADLTQVESGNLVYTDILGLFIVQWDESASVWITLLLMILLGLAIKRLVKRQQLDTKQVFKGVLGAFVLLISAAIGAFIVLMLAQVISGSQTPWHSNNLPMQIALWAMVLLFVLPVARWFAKKASSVDMSVAVVIFWLLLSMASSIWMAGISFLFIIPSAGGVIGLLVMVGLNRSSPTVLIGIATVGALIFLPVVYGLEVMVSYHMAVAMGIVLGLVAVALLPLMSLNENALSDWKKTAYASMAVMVAGLTWTCLQPTYTQWMPQGLNISYVQSNVQGEQGKSYIIAGHAGNHQPESLRQVLPAKTELKHVFPWSKWRYQRVEVPSLELKSATVEVLSTEPNGNGRSVTIVVSAAQQNISYLQVFIPYNSSLTTIKTGAQTLNYEDEKRGDKGYYNYRCIGLSCASMQLTLNFSTTTPSKLLFATRLPGLPAHYQSLADSTGDKTVPIQTGNGSLVYHEVEI